MMAAEFTTFLGWCTVISLGIFMVAAFAALGFGRWMSGIHGAMFGLDPAEVRRIYFSYLGNLKIAIIMLNLVPYLVLRLAM